MISNAVAALGGLDLLVNNAGAPGVREPIPPARLDLMTEELWNTLLQVNLVSLSIQQGCGFSVESIEGGDRECRIGRRL